MFSNCKETLNNFLYKKFVGFSLRISTQDIDKLLRKFKIGWLKSHVVTRRPIKNESKINMDKMALLIYHDVSIVTIFDLQNVTHKTIGCQTLCKVETSLLELLWWFTTISLQEVFVQVDLVCFTKLISTIGIRYALNNTSKKSLVTSSVTDTLIRNKI